MSETVERVRLQFYYREGCHLCDDMWRQLEQMQIEHPFELERLDVDESAETRERLGHLIPVLEGGGETICHYYLDPVALKNYLIKTGAI
ncbi:MAG: glutaredoxin family protein [Candidatus Sedimenticola sp. (ex Thyasira tokunagai)]